MFLAHAGETHETAAEAASHSLFDTWYLALLAFAGFAYCFVRLVYFLSGKSKAVTTNATLVMLFAVGVGTYKLSAPISVVALTAGFALALFQVVVGLSAPSHQTKK